jgi:hypothetical protein
MFAPVATVTVVTYDHNKIRKLGSKEKVATAIGQKTFSQITFDQIKSLYNNIN